MKEGKETLKIGDLVRNKSTGTLYLVTGVGDGEMSIWIMLTEVGESNRSGNNDIVYLSQYFELVSEAGEDLGKE
jgi:hypothetical protein